MRLSIVFVAVACAYRAPAVPASGSDSRGILAALAQHAAVFMHHSDGPETFVSSDPGSPGCTSAADGSSDEIYTVGFARELIPVPAHVRLGGYGLFPFSVFWENESFTTQSHSQLPVETLVISQGQVSWVLISVPVVGLTFETVLQMEKAVRGLAPAAELSRSGIAKNSNCVLVTVSATHTHTAPDATGLWGGVSSHLLWWKAQQEHRQVFFGPLLRAVEAGVRRALSNQHSTRSDLRQATLPTTALKRRAGQTGSGQSSILNSHILRLGDVASFWVADAHAATNLGKGGNGWVGFPGDFPQHISEELKKDPFQNIPLIYAPGVIGRSYPDEQDQWPEKWVQSVRQALGRDSTALPSALSEQSVSGQAPSSPEKGGLSFKQIDLCARPTSRLFSVLEWWSRLWSGEVGQDPCDAQKPGWRTVRLQSVQIAGVEFLFAPFELFPQAAASMKRLMEEFNLHQGLDGRRNVSQELGSRSPQLTVVVSLANGFLGYVAEAEDGDAEPYHRLFSVFDHLP